jgi:hypothetical protein
LNAFVWSVRNAPSRHNTLACLLSVKILYLVFLLP